MTFELKTCLNLGLVACGLTAGAAWSDTWGIGAAGGTAPGLSVQFAPTPLVAYHASAAYGDDSAQITADLQRHLTPGFGQGRGWRLSFYGGLGLMGAARQDDETPEAFHARLPVGTQCDVRELHLSLFAEVAALLGELPMTRLSQAAAIGARATF
jgi:hypothetical protein